MFFSNWLYSLLFYCSDFCLCLHALEMVLQFAILLVYLVHLYGAKVKAVSYHAPDYVSVKMQY